MDENRVKDPLGQYEDGQRAAQHGPPAWWESWVGDGVVVAAWLVALAVLFVVSIGLLIWGLFF